MMNKTVNPKETHALAFRVAKELITAKKKKKYATVIALYGDLGGGKTTFTQGVGRALGVKETVPSPTFIIERIYKIKKSFFTHFIHIDAYRLENSTELKNIGWDDIIQSPCNFIMIEWADKVEKSIPKDAIKIYFKTSDEHEHTRHIDIVYPHAKNNT
ncbi:MAG: tRNA (adenosine(37)-N6)-threonylcarbamoyltransferase complex ATPase subunit type 1 TsaE [bacterium]|nr:tRNA (adenosine(37)-N6)-threonylcarbamoyltransferase complex ATPase subunit type 1 TsaE [bacterium]